ncbi:MAG: hypothetical protein LBR10_02940 [Prevotellaceae bacterium]|jgi:hypothetical protein|nr:hypothetical protein [Prevotellaceae bacterium]
MKRFGLFFALHFLLYSCTSVGTNLQQAQDLSALGYPIIYKNSAFDDNGYVFIEYKNITSEVISEIIFTTEMPYGEQNLRDGSLLRPNQSRKTSWWISAIYRKGQNVPVKGISVIFKSGRTVAINGAQAAVMLDDKNYTSGYLAVAESPSPPATAPTLDVQPASSPSVYHEKSFRDVINLNLTQAESYETSVLGLSIQFKIPDYQGPMYNYKFVSEGYIAFENNKSSDELNISDDNGYVCTAEMSKNFIKTYNIDKNSDFDPSKKYRIKYTFRYLFNMGKLVGKINNFNEQISVDGIEITDIEGLLTYEQSLEKDKQNMAEEKQQELLRKQAEVKAAYEKALSSNGIASVIEYIHVYRREDGFNKDCYAEIARRVTKNRNIAFKEIYTAPNPYAFDTKTVYYCSSLTVQSFTKGTIIAYTGNVFISDEDVVFLSSVPDIKDIGRSIPNAYLKYNGTTVLSSASGRKREVPSFDLIYSFE